MLTTTRSASCWARFTRAMWPACRLPMVGTSATFWSMARQRAMRLRSSATECSVITQKTSCPSWIALVKAVLGSGVALILDGLHVGGHALGDAARPFHEVSGELGL